MKIFNAAEKLQGAFDALDRMSAASSAPCIDGLPNRPLLHCPKVGSLLMKAKEITADTGSDMDPSTAMGLYTMGTVTAFSTGLGVITLDKVYNSHKESEAMHDGMGKAQAKWDASLRVTQIIGGVADVLATFTPKNWTSLQFQATAVVGVCLDFLYVGLACLSALSIYEISEFITNLKRAEKGGSELEAFIGELTGKGPVNLERSLSDRDVYIHLGKELRSLLSEIDPSLTEYLSDRKLGKALFDPKYSKYLVPILHRMNITLDPHKAIDLPTLKRSSDLTRHVWAKEKSFVLQRKVGERGLELLQKAKKMDLHGLFSKEKTRAYAEANSRALLKELKECAKSQRHTSLAYFTAAFVGGFFTALAWAFIIPAETTLSKIGFLTFFFLMGYGDVRDFLEVYRSGARPGEYAKYISLTHLALGVLAIGAFAVATAFTGGAFPIATLIIVGGAWITIDIWMLLFMRAREVQYAKDHPSLKEFVKVLNHSKVEPLSEEALEMFQKLPRLQREAILRSLMKDHPQIMQLYKAKLKSFAMDAKADLAAKGKELFESKKTSPALVQKAFARVNFEVLRGSEPITLETIDNHPSKELFFESLYSELASFEQKKFCQRAGAARIQSAVEKVFAATHKPVKKTASSKESLRWAFST